MSKNKNIFGDLVLKLEFQEDILILYAGFEPGKTLIATGY